MLLASPSLSCANRCYWLPTTWTQPQVWHLISDALHMIPSSGHGCGVVHDRVTDPWLWSYFATVFVRSPQGPGFLHVMMALGIFTSYPDGSVNYRLMHTPDDIEWQLGRVPVSCPTRLLYQTVLLPAAGSMRQQSPFCSCRCGPASCPLDNAAGKTVTRAGTSLYALQSNMRLAFVNRAAQPPATMVQAPNIPSASPGRLSMSDSRA